MNSLLTAVRMFAFLTVLTGFVYPFVVTGIALGAFPGAATGSRAVHEGQLVGSVLIAQKFEQTRYFWPRPSANGYNALSSGGRNLGHSSAELKKSHDERLAMLIAAHPNAGEPPQDLLFASGSGLDPHISIESALYQTGRVATQRGISLATVQALIRGIAEGPQFGILGEPRVNVLLLNLALDRQLTQTTDSK